jgi:hypothetical protein
MRSSIALLLCVAASAAVAPKPAYACGFSWKKGQSPAEVKRSPAIIKVKGTYKLDRVVGTRDVDGAGPEIVYDGSGTVYHARLLGTLTLESGKKWKTINEPMPEEVGDGGGGCVDYINRQFPVPEADAEGTFWIEAKTRRGRHKIRIWEGRYLLPDTDNGKTKE